MPAGPATETPLGRPRLHLRRCDSTNARARSLALDGAPHGTLVSADEQTAGRGRQGRTWLAPAGACLLCSLVLREQHTTSPATLLPLIAGVALCDAIDQDAMLKWPNDVVLGDDLAKVAGILVEGRPQDGWAVVGIGVNVALRLQELPADVRARAGTLGLPHSAIEPLLQRFLQALSACLQESPQRVLERWRSADALRGREVSWAEGCGTAQGVDDRGRLLVRRAGGAVARLSAGDVHLSAAG
jgi:BirA family biotin operon repressor/biotin-[acetyl-CoA-carboxylase] ligase